MEARIDDLLVRLERERLDADRVYNDALTALDRALVAAPTLPTVAAVGMPPESTPGGPTEALSRSWDIVSDGAPSPAGGLKGRLQSLVWRIVGPSLERQKRFNALLVEQAIRQARADEAHVRTLGQLVSAVGLALDRLVRFQALLLQYLRTITLYVDTKDRSVGGQEIKERLALTEQRVLTLRRELEHLLMGAPSGVAPGERSRPAPAAPRAASMESSAYVGFEDRFRGSQDEIRGRVEEYVSLLSTVGDVVDIGCGRGELLDLLKTHGVSARGVDANPAMVEVCRARGLRAEEGDALSYLTQQPDASIGGLIAIQVVEHFTPGYLVRFLDTAFQKLCPGAPIVLETLNPACWLAFFETYIRDPTHQQPLHPDTLRFLVQASGFCAVDVHFKRPVSVADRLDRVAHWPGGDAGWTALAAAVNAHADKLNARLFSSADYAVVGRR